jgi:hypothetical protein
MIPAGTVERGERKRTVDEVSEADEVMSKPRVDPTFEISSVAVPLESAAFCTAHANRRRLPRSTKRP